MKRRPALALVLTASTLSALSCGTAADEPPAGNPADAWINEVKQLQLEITSEHGDGEFTETRMGGGHVSAGAERSLSFDPIVSGPIAASFLCDTGTVSASIAGGRPSDVECGQVEVFSGVEPYEFDTGLMITVGSDHDAHWAVEFRSED